MFPAGSMKHDAVMVLLPTRELAVLVDNKMIVLNKNLDKTGDVIWNDSPIGLGEDIFHIRTPLIKHL